MSYLYDWNSAAIARTHMAEVLSGVQRIETLSSVSIIAHSMGAWVALEAVRELHGDDQFGRQKLHPFEAMILASPDIDIDLFRQDLPPALASVRKVVLLTSDRDNLLALSRFLAGGVPRAGAATIQDLLVYHVQEGTNFSILRMDGSEIASCVGGYHRCSETNQIILNQIRGYLEVTADARAAVD